MKHHPFTDIWPMLDEADFAKFKADIATNGQRLPALLYRGQLIDGRNRKRACEELGVAVRYEESGAASEEEALALIVSLNEHRRHLSENQRALAADKLANIIHGYNRYVEKIVDISKEMSTPFNNDDSHRPMSLMAAAHAMNVAPMRVARMRGVRKYGGQSAVDEVLSGKVSLTEQFTKVSKAKNVPKGAKRGRPPKRQRLDGLNPLGQPSRESLTMQEHMARIDPEFVGTSMDWTDKYGHVQIMTAEQYATERFGTWAFNLQKMRKVFNGSSLAQDWPTVDRNWLRNPRQRDIAKLAEALEFLRPKIAEAEALLERARVAEEVKRPAPHQPDALSLPNA